MTHLGNLVIAIEVVHTEGEVQLLHPRVQLVLRRVLLDGTEVGNHADKVLGRRVILRSVRTAISPKVVP